MFRITRHRPLRLPSRSLLLCLLQPPSSQASRHPPTPVRQPVQLGDQAHQGRGAHGMPDSARSGANGTGRRRNSTIENGTGKAVDGGTSWAR